MIERFSAQGSPDLWLASSIEALEVSDFNFIDYEPGERQVTGYQNGKLNVRVFPEKDNQTELILESDTKENIDIYKRNVTRALAFFQRQPEEAIYFKLSTPIGEYESTEENFITTPKEPEYALETIQSNVPGVIPTSEIPESYPEDQEEEVIQPVVPWYKTTWFTLLICVLCPPVGIYLLWKFKIFYEKDRKIFTVFFALYTVLWIWLIYILIFPKSTSGFLPNTVNETGSQVDQINAYWGQEQVVNYMTQMPDLIITYENLNVNSELGSEDGNATAQNVYNQVQALSEAVLNISELQSSNAAYTLQQKVNESANLFLVAVQEGRDALNSGDINQITNSLGSWTTAENAFYEINYIYQNAIQMATDNTSSQSGTEDVLVVDNANNTLTPSGEETQESTDVQVQTEAQDQIPQDNQTPTDASQTPSTLEATEDNMVAPQ